MKVIPSGLIKHFEKTWEKRTGENVHDINYGWCYQFALILHRIHGNKVKLCTTYGHAWVEYDGKHYDSDFPRGTKTMPIPESELPFSYVTPEQLAERWDTYGFSGEVRWDIINEVATIYLSPKKRPRIYNGIKAILRLKQRS